MIEFIEQKNVYNLEMNSDIADWLDEMEPDSRFLHFVYLNIYGVPVILDEALEEAYHGGDTSKFNNIGRLTGYYIPFEEILEEGEDPVDVCDAASADLEFVASIIQDYYEENESMMFSASLFYIDELEIDEQYRNNGFGSKVLQELPCLLNYHKGIEIDDIAYYPVPTRCSEKILTPYEEALMKQTAYKMNEYYGGESAAFQMSKNKIISLPRNYSKEGINEMIESEKNTPSYPEKYKNNDLFSFYEKNGYKEFNQTRLLIKGL